MVSVVVTVVEKCAAGGTGRKVTFCWINGVQPTSNRKRVSTPQPKRLCAKLLRQPFAEPTRGNDNAERKVKKFIFVSRTGY
jgi:hypothetical protein